MKVVTHPDLPGRRRRQATLLSLAGLGILVVGLYFNFQGNINVATLALVVGSIASWIGIGLADKWIRPPRADQALENGLAGDKAVTIYNWTLPADHVILGPWGLTVAIVSNVDGPATFRDGSWHETRPLWRRLLTLGRRPLGRPERLAELEIADLRGALAEEDVDLDAPINALLVFSNPDIQIDAQGADDGLVLDADPPGVKAHALKAWLRQAKRDGGLTAGERRRLEKALDHVVEARLGG